MSTAHSACDFFFNVFAAEGYRTLEYTVIYPAYIINRPSVAGAVVQTHLSFIRLLFN